MPSVKPGETKDEYIKRCIPFVISEGTAKDGSQAAAICHSLWDKHLEGKAGNIDNLARHLASKYGGDPGFFTTCMGVEELADYDEETRKAICARVHQIVTGKWPSEKNALKAVGQDDDLLFVANYIVLFGGRDAEGILSKRRNADGSIGEFFTPETQLESTYTKSGRVYLDWEHLQDPSPDAPGNDDEVLGYVDWSTAKADETGVWVKRALYRHREYMKFLEQLIADGVIGTSSEAVAKKIKKATDGEIIRWPIRRDTLTVTPMEWRNKSENVIAALKGLAEYVPAIKSALHLATPEPEAAPEAAKAAVAAARVKASSTLAEIEIAFSEE